MIESEIKFEIRDRESFQRTLAYLETAAGKPVDPVRQVNHYLDTADLRLSKAMVMLRLRAGPGTVLTYKSGTTIQRGHFHSLELEVPISDEDREAILGDPSAVYRLDLPPVEALRQEFGVLPLRVIGELINHRSAFRIEGFTVELDRMEFPNGEEYEVEIESSDPERARRWCTERLGAIGADAAPGSETKFQRLLRRLTSG